MGEKQFEKSDFHPRMESSPRTSALPPLLVFPDLLVFFSPVLNSYRILVPAPCWAVSILHAEQRHPEHGLWPPLGMRMCSVRSDSLQPYDCWLPGSCPWDSPGKNTGVGCHFLLQGIVPTRNQTRVSSISCISRQIPYH